jgi:glycosyltransferase involved in cell wall biosynthesis
MSDPLVSVVVPMYRPGGLDITFTGLGAQTFGDFEIIIVDNRYEKRHTSVLLMANVRKTARRVIHAPEHRRNGKWIVSGAAFNTGFALARGKYVVTLPDYSYVPPDWIERVPAWLDRHPRRLLTLPYRHYDLPEVRSMRPDVIDFERNMSVRHCTDTMEVAKGGVLDEVAVFKRGLFEASWMADAVPSTRKMDGSAVAWGDERPRGQGLLPVQESAIAMRVEAIHRDYLYELNGLDERFNRGRGALDHDFGRRVLNTGGEIMFDSNAPEVAYFNPHWLVWTMPFGDTAKRAEGRWSDADCYDYLARRRSGRRAQNPFDLRALAEQLEPWRHPMTVCVPRDISDLAYYRREVWPDTPTED